MSIDLVGLAGITMNHPEYIQTAMHNTTIYLCEFLMNIFIFINHRIN